MHLVRVGSMVSIFVLTGCGARVIEGGDNGNGRLVGAADSAVADSSTTSVREASAGEVTEPSGPVVSASEFPDLPPCEERPPTCGPTDPAGTASETLNGQAAACKEGLGMSGGEVHTDWCGTLHATFDAQGCLERVSAEGLTRDQLACLFEPWNTAKKQWPCFAGTTVSVTGRCP